MKLKNIGAFLVLSLLLFAACKKKEYEPIESVDAAKIATFFKDNNLSMSKSDSGYYYQIVKNGTGKVLKYTDTMVYQVSYKSLTGQLFYQSSAYVPSEILLGYLSPAAARQTLKGLNTGAEVRMIIPSYLAFGINGNSTLNIGANESLDIDIKSISFADRNHLEDSLIQKFIADNKIANTVKDASGIYYAVETAGTGASIALSSTLTINYSGRFLDGVYFDNGGTGVSILLSNTITGWRTILPKFSSGVKLRMIIPSRYGYGNGLSGKTGEVSFTTPNAVLDFEVEVTAVN